MQASHRDLAIICVASTEIPSLMSWGYQTKLVHYLQQQKWRHNLQKLNNALVEIFLCEAFYVQMVCTAMVLEKKPCKSRICAFCTHLHFVFGGFAFGCTAFPCFSFCCFFFHATATLKERSSSACEWSLGFTLKVLLDPPT